VRGAIADFAVGRKRMIRLVRRRQNWPSLCFLLSTKLPLKGSAQRTMSGNLVAE